MDEEIRRRARAARAEVEGHVDVESELAAHRARPMPGVTPISALPSRGRIVAVAGSIAAVAVAIVGGVVLFGGTDSIETTEPSTPTVATSDARPAATPATAGPVTTTPTSDGPGAPADVASTTTPSIPNAPATAASTTTSTVAPTTTVAATVPITVPITVPSNAVSWRSLPSESAGIPRSCANGFVDCTQLLVDLHGTLVSYDPTTRRLTRHSTPPVEATLPTTLADGSFLWHLGPDDVVYLGVPGASDEHETDVVAVTLAADDSARELARWSGVTDSSGDSDLVATREGLVVVGCCDHELLRPAPDAEVVVPWVGRDGGDATISGPVMRTEVEFPTLTVHRENDLPAGTRSWTFEPPADWQPRGMPTVLPTFDGGFVATTYGSGDETIIRGWDDGTIAMVVIEPERDGTVPFPHLDPNGRATVADGDHFARFEPVADRAEFWAGRPEYGDDGGVTLPDIDTAIDFEAAWARDPIAFGNAVAGRLAANERRTIELQRPSDAEFVVSVTTSDHFDDSVSASRLELTLRRDDDGRFRFVSGHWAQTCQPGRGQQDFAAELCV